MERIIRQIKQLSNPRKAVFDASLSPLLPKDSFLGVKCGDLRKIALKMSEEERDAFFKEIPHTYHEEDLIHVYLINSLKNYDRCVAEIHSFLPYMNDWSITDPLKPMVLMRKPKKTETLISKWLKDKNPFTVRVGILLSMKFYLKDSFSDSLFQQIISLKSDYYYVQMAQAWYLAETLLYQQELVFSVLKEEKLSVSVHNKTIQKAIESYRIPEETKRLLRSIRR